MYSSKESKFYMNYPGIQPFIVMINHSPLGKYAKTSLGKVLTNIIGNNNQPKFKSRCEWEDPDICRWKMKKQNLRNTSSGSKFGDRRKILRLKKPEINIPSTEMSKIMSPSSLKGRKLNNDQLVSNLRKTNRARVNPLTSKAQTRKGKILSNPVAKSSLKEINFDEIFLSQPGVDNTAEFREIKEKTRKLLFCRDLSL